jgi:hypothetical protein
MRNPVGQGKFLIVAELMPAWQAPAHIFVRVFAQPPCPILRLRHARQQPMPAARHGRALPGYHVFIPGRFSAHHGRQSPAHIDSSNKSAPFPAAIDIGQYVKKYHQ